MRLSVRNLPRRASGAILVLAISATAAGAATLHRLSVSQATGSLGSQTFVQTTSADSALQGEVGSTANTTIKIPFGVLGEYDASSGPVFGIGVAGISTTGYGVAGEALGSQPSVLGLAGGSGYGVEGITPATSPGAAVVGYASGSGAGGDFESHSGDALIAFSPGIGGVATLGLPTGEGLEASGYSGVAAHPVIAGYSFSAGTDLMGLYGQDTSGSGQENFIVQAGTLNESGGALANGSDVQVSGDLYVYGHVYQDCNGYPAKSGIHCYEDALGTSVGLTDANRSSNVRHAATYGSDQSLPTVEDFGQAQLVGGRAYVRLDPAFAAKTNPGSPYLVLVTPEGDSRGVFTANHTRSGFEIHENAAGRSTLTVDYRIVAKPLGDRSQRFAADAREIKLGYMGQVKKRNGTKPAEPKMPRSLLGVPVR